MSSGSLDTFPVEILDDIFGLVQASEKLVIREVCSRFKNLIPLQISTLDFTKMVKTFHITATFPAGYFPREFLSRPAISDSNKPVNGEVTYFRTFAYPPTSNYSLFDFAEIDHLKMEEKLPLYLNNDNLVHLKNLLYGCTIKKLSLAFENDSLSNLTEVPSLAARYHTNHVDFLFAGNIYLHRLTPFLHGALASDLVKAGVKEVTFSGKGFDYNQPIFSLKLLLSFFDAGIKRITVNPGALMANEIKTHNVETFVTKLAKLGKRLHLDLHASLFYEELSGRRLNAMKGVKAAKASRQRRYRIFTPQGTLASTPTLLSIECDGTGNM